MPMIDSRPVITYLWEGIIVARRFGLGIFGGLILAACSSHNPAACCTSVDQCFAVGLDQVYGCEAGLVCNTTGTCIEGDCLVAADCTAAVPFCLHNHCSASCVSDADCAGSETPTCSSDGSCVACLGNDACTANAPTCDVMTHSCRACAVNTDCASDSCNEATGTCIDGSVIAYVSNVGVDSGACTQSVPCRTFVYMSSVLGTRTRIHILGTSYSSGANSNVIPIGAAVIDSNNAVVTTDGTDAGPAVFSTGTNIVNVELQSTTVGTDGVHAASLSITSGSSITAQHVKLLQPFNVVASGTLLIEDSELGGVAASTSAGALTIRRSQLHNGVTATGGTLSYQRNLFSHPTAGAIVISSNITGSIENSIFVSNGATAPVIALHGFSLPLVAATLVNLQATSAPAIACDLSGGKVVGSVIGWNNASLLNCVVDYSLFNGTGTATGTNLVGAIGSFFVDLAGQDFHLLPTSPAVRGVPVGTATNGHVIADDFDGSARPNPVGSPSDIGAYESPN